MSEASRAGADFLRFMESAPEHALRGPAIINRDEPRHYFDEENNARRAMVMARALNSVDAHMGDIRSELQTTIDNVPAFAVVRSIYHARMKRSASLDEAPDNPGNIRQRRFFDTILLAHAACPDEKLRWALPLLDPEVFMPYLDAAMDVADPYKTDQHTRKRQRDEIEFSSLRALVLGVRSEIHNDMRFLNEGLPLPADARDWQAEDQHELAQYTEGSDGAGLMINACLANARDLN